MVIYFPIGESQSVKVTTFQSVCRSCGMSVGVEQVVQGMLSE